MIATTLHTVDDVAHRRPGRRAASLLMRFAFTLASFTCTAAFVGALLVSAAHGEWHRPLVGILVSLVLHAPLWHFPRRHRFGRCSSRSVTVPSKRALRGALLPGAGTGKAADLLVSKGGSAQEAIDKAIERYNRKHGIKP